MTVTIRISNGVLGSFGRHPQRRYNANSVTILRVVYLMTMIIYKALVSLSVRCWVILLCLFVAIPWLVVTWYSRVFMEHPSVCIWLHEDWKHKPIPKHIHKTWMSNTVPDKFKKQWDNCKRLNPGYNITLWTDADLESFIKTHYSWFLPTYKDYPYPIERVDAARYFIVYHYGGIYLDMDVDCKQPFDVMFKNLSRVTNADVFTGSAQGGGLTNSFFASKARHPFLYLLLRLLISSSGWYITPYFSVLLSTGPMFMTKVYYKYPCPEDIYVIYDDRFTVHDHASTWHAGDGAYMVWLYYHRVPLFSLLGLLGAALVLFYIYKRIRNKTPSHWYE